MIRRGRENYGGRKGDGQSHALGYKNTGAQTLLK